MLIEIARSLAIADYQRLAVCRHIIQPALTEQ